MRITPMAVFLTKIEDIENVKNAVSADISMTHPSPVVHNAALLYCLAIRHLINCESFQNKTHMEAGIIHKVYNATKENYLHHEHKMPEGLEETPLAWLDQAKEFAEAVNKAFEYPQISHDLDNEDISEERGEIRREVKMIIKKWNVLE